MDNEKLLRTLRSVGFGCFVEYYELFGDEGLESSDIAKRIRREKNYSENTCRSRTSSARTIIRSGNGGRALRIIVNATHKLVGEETREKAQRLLNQGVV